MGLDKKLLLTSMSASVVPLLGSGIASGFLYIKLRDIFSSYQYLLSCIPITAFTTGIASYVILGNIYFALYLVAASILTPLIVPIVASQKYKSVETKITENYIEIDLKVPVNISSYDPNELFNHVYKKASRSIRNPYYSKKLGPLNNCGHLKVTYIGDDKMVLRRRCGELFVEVTITPQREANMSVRMAY
ncbi:hypothetical protein [Sulfuracidifex metallicus]|uniref:Uncharacterized protein n=1 Tax=Sulfuracidifex metallicus DSM 6482 = JCM 9184 TaxID=523847 RepID=A0A6A9QGI8_SULME|nr:hypothetical protein [Sulfuracidifex metallicus]MUN28196.1 hypothetical protein [Sulfuracidifex metallicus DSM 6482 = JCM 9184]